jgi:WD repeat-containing protein 1 (actin-interacting protein 1)
MIDSSNNSLPNQHPVIATIPPLPTCFGRKDSNRQRCSFTGDVGRLHQSLPMVVYPSNKSVVCRTLPIVANGSTIQCPALLPNLNTKLAALVYRGHSANVTAVAVSKSGGYIASGDEKGSFKVWAFDHVEHLCKYSINTMLSGPIHDLEWDSESKRIVLCGERSPTDTMTGVNTKVVQWDTGVSIVSNTGTGMGIHLPRGRASSCTMKLSRPMRVVSSGMDDGKVCLHSGPPFTKVSVDAEKNTPMETAHKTGTTVHAVRYNTAGTYVVSVGSDKSICLYDGTTLSLLCKMEHVHDATIYDMAWSSSNDSILTASGDGTCKLFSVTTEGDQMSLQEIGVWSVAQCHIRGLVQSLEQLAISAFPVGGIQMGCTFVQNGSLPVAVGYNGQIVQLLPDGSCQMIATGHCAPISAAAFFIPPDNGNGVMYTGDTDGVLCQWEVTVGTNESDSHITPIQRVEPLEKNNLMFASHHGAISGTALLHAIKSGCEPFLLSIGWDDILRVSIDGKVQHAVSLVAQPSAIASGTHVACIATVKGLLFATNRAKSTGESPVSVSVMVPLPYEAQVVAITTCDTTLFVGGKDCKLYVYSLDSNNLAEPTLKHTVTDGHLKPIYSLSLSPDGKRLASADERDVCVWDVTNIPLTSVITRGKWCFHTQRITSLAWSPCNRVLISGGADDSIYLWCLEQKMKRIHYNYAHRGGIISVHCIPAPHKYQFISTGVDSVVNIWDATEDIRKKFDLTI